LRALEAPELIVVHQVGQRFLAGGHLGLVGGRRAQLLDGAAGQVLQRDAAGLRVLGQRCDRQVDRYAGCGAHGAQALHVGT